MPNPLTEKLQRSGALDDADRTVLDGLTAPSASLNAREAILQEGDRCGAIYVLVSGWACRFKSQAGLPRQIVGFLIPGDHVRSDPALPSDIDYGVCTLSSCEIAETSIDDLEPLLRERPRVDRALRRAALVDEAILREWLFGLGRRPAERRMAHLFCELLARLQAVGLAQADGFAFPLTQVVLGDALGLSPAHVNRSLQSLRARRLVAFDGGVVRIASVDRLQKFAGFSPRYLHLGAIPAAAAA